MKNNYKQKWLDALREKTDEVERSTDKHGSHLSDTSRIAADTSLALRQISSVTGELVHEIKTLINEMNDHRIVGSLEFHDVDNEVDENLSRLPVHVALRRVRDIIKLTTARVAMTSLHLDDTHNAKLKLEQSIELLKTSNMSATKTLQDVAWIGPAATTSEIEDFNDKAAGEFHRDGLKYNDLEDDWIETSLLKSVTLRQRNVKTGSNNTGEDSSESEDEDSDLDTANYGLARVRSTNRQAAVIPRSPLASKAPVGTLGF